MIITVTPQLREALIAAVEAEGWDEDHKIALVEELRALPDGYRHDEDQDVDEDDDSGYVEDSLSSLIDYFGVWHLARTSRVVVNLRESLDGSWEADPVVVEPVFPVDPTEDALAPGHDGWVEVRPMSPDDLLEWTQGVVLVSYTLRWRRETVPA